MARGRRNDQIQNNPDIGVNMEGETFKNTIEPTERVQNGLQKSLAKTLPKSMEELMARIEKYAKVEEDTLGTKASKQEKRNNSPK